MVRLCKDLWYLQICTDCYRNFFIILTKIWLLSSFQHFYFSFDIDVGFLLCFWVCQFFFESANICKDLQEFCRSAHICKELQKSCRSAQILKDWKPGHTLPGWLSIDILVRSWQDLGTILAKIFSTSCHDIQLAMVRFYQESHVPRNFFVIVFCRKKTLKGSNKNQHLTIFSWQGIKFDWRVLMLFI